ncbi:MAG: transcriptional repressor [Melioribacteraceae bacterium]|nr:transcriptional repressor [Melioribacteraceae bacterium]
MKDNKKAHDIFTKFLKNGKNRITPERFQVLDVALEMEEHFGADELYLQIKMNKINVSRATVYNTLELLVQCKLLVKRNFGDNIAKYESCFERKRHDHLVCTDCGKIFEFTDTDIYPIIDKICTESNFEFNNYSFNIFGKCKDKSNCTKQNENLD